MLRQSLIRLASAAAGALLLTAALSTSAAPPRRPPTQAELQAEAQRGQTFGAHQSRNHGQPQVTIQQGEGDQDAGTITIAGEKLDITHVTGANPTQEVERLKALRDDEDARNEAVQQKMQDLQHDPTPAADALRVATEAPADTSAVINDHAFWRQAEGILRNPALVDQEFADCSTETTYRDVGANDAALVSEDTCERLNVLDKATRERHVTMEAKTDKVEDERGTITKDRLNITVRPDIPEDAFDVEAELTWRGEIKKAELDGQPSPFRDWAFSYSMFYDPANAGPVCISRITQQTCTQGTPDCDCGPKPQSYRVIIHVSYKVLKETFTSDPANPLMDSDNFCQAKWTCTDSAPRTIGGVPITGSIISRLGDLYPVNATHNTPPSSKAPLCWKAEAKYDCPYNLGRLCWTAADGTQQCSENTTTNTTRDTCQRFATPRCEQVPDPLRPGSTIEQCTSCGYSRSSCNEFAKGHNDFCYVETRVYTCSTPVRVPLIEAQTRSSCTGKIDCLGGECIDQNRNAEKVQGVAAAYSGMTLVQHMLSDRGIKLPPELADPYPNSPQAAALKQQQAAALRTKTIEVGDIELFPGKPFECKKALGGTLNCCEEGDGGDEKWFELYQSMLRKGNTEVAVQQYRASGGKAQGSWVQAAQGTLTNEALNNPYTSLIEGATGGSRFGYYSKAGDSDAKATTLEPVMTEYRRQYVDEGSDGYTCSTEELDLAGQRSLGACSALGSYCKRSVLGACLDQRTAYCCFNSALSRMIHEKAVGGAEAIAQGAFGTPSNPQCPGLSVAELSEANLEGLPLDQWAARLDAGGVLPRANNVKTLTNVDRLTGAGSNLTAEAESGKNLIQRTVEKTAQQDRGEAITDLENEQRAKQPEVPAYIGPGQLTFGPALYFSGIGDTTEIVVNRMGGTGPLTASWRVIEPHASLRMLFQSATSGTLTWADGDTAQKTIKIRLARDAALTQRIEAGNERVDFRVALASSVEVGPATEARVVLTHGREIPPPPVGPRIEVVKRATGYERLVYSGPQYYRAHWLIAITNATGERITSYTISDVLPSGVYRGRDAAGNNMPLAFPMPNVVHGQQDLGDFFRYCTPRTQNPPDRAQGTTYVNVAGSPISATCVGVTPIEPGGVVTLGATAMFDSWRTYTPAETTNTCVVQVQTASGRVYTAQCAAPAVGLPVPPLGDYLQACQQRGYIRPEHSVIPLGAFTGEAFVPEFRVDFTVPVRDWVPSIAFTPQQRDHGRTGRIRITPSTDVTAFYARISPCAGELGYPWGAQQKPYDQAECTTLRSDSAGQLLTGDIEFIVTSTATGHGKCPLIPGVPYYLTLVTDDPRDGLNEDYGAALEGCTERLGEEPCRLNVAIDPDAPGPRKVAQVPAPAAPKSGQHDGSEADAGERAVSTTPPAAHILAEQPTPAASTADATPSAAPPAQETTPAPLAPTPGGVPSIYVDANAARTHTGKEPPPGYAAAATPARFEDLTRAKRPWPGTRDIDLTLQLRAGQYAAIAFTPHDEGGKLRVVSWSPPRSINSRPAGAYLTISDRPGDFRRPQPGGDPVLATGCRATLDGSAATQGALYYRVGTAQGSERVCTLAAGKTYYVNVIYDAPIDGFNAMRPPCTSDKKVCSYDIAFK